MILSPIQQGTLLVNRWGGAAMLNSKLSAEDPKLPKVPAHLLEHRLLGVQVSLGPLCPSWWELGLEDQGREMLIFCSCYRCEYYGPASRLGLYNLSQYL